MNQEITVKTIPPSPYVCVYIKLYKQLYNGIAEWYRRWHGSSTMDKLEFSYYIRCSPRPLTFLQLIFDVSVYLTEV